MHFSIIVMKRKLKPQTNYAEHINYFSVLFLWAKNSNKANNDVLIGKQSLPAKLQAATGMFFSHLAFML